MNLKKNISCFDILEKYKSLHSLSSLRVQCSAVSLGSCTASLLRRQESTSESTQSYGHISKVDPRFRESDKKNVKAGIQKPSRSCKGRNPSIEQKKPHTPSGADLVSQWLGKVCIFSKPSLAESIGWPFKNLSFALIQTGENLKTWKHLENLKQKNFSKLKEISLKALEAVRSSSEPLFLQSIQDYQKALEEQGLTHPSTKKILQQLDSHPEILAVKGCGAMGAEVIVVFFKKDTPLDFLKIIKCTLICRI